MKNYRYYLPQAFDMGIKEHPQIQMNKLGYNVIKSGPVPIGDCWWFRVENEINNTPA